MTRTPGTLRKRMLTMGFALWTLFGVILLAQIVRERFVFSLVPVAHDGDTDVGIPVRLRIPSLSIDVPIDPVTLTKEGAMDMPQAATKVGWYRLAAKPGQKGNAVIAGHYDTALSTRGVFFDLEKISIEDEVLVSDDRGHEWRFRVYGIETLDFDDTVELRNIFGPAPESFLNLITCEGPWDRGRSTYLKRLIVKTERIVE